MTNQEKDIIRTLTSQIKNLSKTKTKAELVRYVDYTIFLRKRLDHSDEFMEKLYFIRYYINNVASKEVKQ